MSADNGIYIGRFNEENGPIYKVIHTQAIENCNKSPYWPEDLIDAEIVSYYGQAKTFNNPDTAMLLAITMEDEIESNDGFTEYGICQINYGQPFPTMTKEEAEQIIEDFWADRGQEKSGDEVLKQTEKRQKVVNSIMHQLMQATGVFFTWSKWQQIETIIEKEVHKLLV